MSAQSNVVIVNSYYNRTVEFYAITNPWEKMIGCGLMNCDNDNSAPMM